MVARKIFFCESTHKYVDDLNNPYTSTTTLIGKYHKEFDTWGRAKQVVLKKDSPYYGMKPAQVIKIWDQIRDDACKKGTAEHAILENSFDQSANIVKSTDDYRQLITLDDIIEKKLKGATDINILRNLLPSRHSKIISVAEYLINKGYEAYSEVAVYSADHLISGSIDLLFINWKTRTFITGDYKTNAAPIQFIAGYYKKDQFRNRTDEFVSTNETMLFPIAHIPKSIGHKYALQLSIYSYMVEMRNLTHKGNVLFHIREVSPVEYVIDIPDVPYLRDEAIAMFEDHKKKLKSNSQLDIFMNTKFI